MEPITKEDLIEGVLKMFQVGALSMEVTIGQIRIFAEDTRLNWKN